LQRAEIPTNYSQGFNPSPKVSFGPALPVGTESYGEYFIMDLTKPLKDILKAQSILNNTLPPGLKVTGIELHSGKVPQKMKVSYSIRLGEAASKTQQQAALQFSAAETFLVKKTRKGKTKEIDIRPLISKFSFTGPREVELEVIAESAQPGIKPIEAVVSILGISEKDVNHIEIVKKGWVQLD
jgi:radical SAM-linked protein